MFVESGFWHYERGLAFTEMTNGLNSVKPLQKVLSGVMGLARPRHSAMAASVTCQTGEATLWPVPGSVPPTLPWEAWADPSEKEPSPGRMTESTWSDLRPFRQGIGASFALERCFPVSPCPRSSHQGGS